MNENGIPKHIWLRIIEALSHNSKVETITLFGSRAMGKHREGSDIDIALTGDDLTHQDIVSLLLAYDNLDLPWKLDLLLLNDTTDPEMLGHIERQGLVVWQRD